MGRSVTDIIYEIIIFPNKIRVYGFRGYRDGKNDKETDKNKNIVETRFCNHIISGSFFI